MAAPASLPIPPLPALRAVGAALHGAILDRIGTAERAADPETQQAKCHQKGERDENAAAALGRVGVAHVAGLVWNTGDTGPATRDRTVTAPVGRSMRAE